VVAADLFVVSTKPFQCPAPLQWLVSVLAAPSVNSAAHRLPCTSANKGYAKEHSLLGKHPQPPFDVVARCAQDGVEPVSVFALEVAPIHELVCIQML
jgi:hypothetical protein